MQEQLGGGAQTDHFSSLTSGFETGVAFDTLGTNYLLSSVTNVNNLNTIIDNMLNFSLSSLLNITSSLSGGITDGVGSSNIVDSFASSGADATNLYTIEHTELDNMEACGDGEETEDGTATSDPHEHAQDLGLGEGCDDYFDFGVSNPFDISLYIDGANYVLSTYFSFSPDGAQAIAGNRLWSIEDESATLYTIGTLNSVDPVASVPEPSTIALLGISLLGFAGSRKAYVNKKFS